MTGIIRTNPALRRRLEAILTGQDEGAMLALFPTLTNSERRTASWLLGEELLPRLEGSETFMYWFDALTAADVRAHLGTCLKAAATRLSRGTVDLADRRWDTFAARATAIDRRKTLDAMLPLATDLTTADHLLKRFAADSITSTATACLRAATTPALFRLFTTLQTIEGDTERIVPIYKALLKLGHRRAFKTASLVRSHFGLESLPGTFSLQLEPWQTDRVAVDYDKFARLIEE